MKYAMCPKCGRRLCKGEEDDIHISKKPIFTTPDVPTKLKQHA